MQSHLPHSRPACPHLPTRLLVSLNRRKNDIIVHLGKRRAHVLSPGIISGRFFDIVVNDLNAPSLVLVIGHQYSYTITSFLPLSTLQEAGSQHTLIMMLAS